TNPPNPDGIAALIPQLFFVKAEAHPLRRDEDEFVVSVGELSVDESIPFFDLNRDDAAFSNVAVIGEIRFLHDTGLRCEDDVEIFIPGLVDCVRSSARLL